MSPDTDIDVVGMPLDEEKQSVSPPLSPRENEFLVGWDGDNDPLNPQNLPVLRKWFIVIIVSLGSLLV